MKQTTMVRRLAAAALSLMLLLALAACGGQTAPTKETEAPASAETVKPEGPSDTLKGIFEALTAPDSGYTLNREQMKSFYPELEYEETLGPDRITLSFKANGNQYFNDGTWDFVEDGSWLTAVLSDDDYTGIINVLYMGDAIGTSFGMDSEVITGYMNGLAMLGGENDNFRMTADEAAGTTAYALNIAGPWDMKELDQMVLNAAILDDAPLDSNFTSQGGSVGKIRYLANGSAEDYTVLLAEYGELDDVAYRSAVNLVSLRQPVGWEAFLADFTALKELETDDYAVDLDPDDASIEEIMGQRDDKFSYMLLRFGAESGGESYETYVPEAEIFADFYFRRVGSVPLATAGSSLDLAAAACDVLAFASGNELWLSDTETLRNNMLAGWESLTDEERANFDACFPELNELLYGCFADWEQNRGRFDTAGVADTMDELLADGTSEWSWEALSANTWTLGNSD